MIKALIFSTIQPTIFDLIKSGQTVLPQQKPPPPSKEALEQLSRLLTYFKSGLGKPTPDYVHSAWEKFQPLNIKFYTEDDDEELFKKLQMPWSAQAALKAKFGALTANQLATKLFRKSPDELLGVIQEYQNDPAIVEHLKNRGIDISKLKDLDPEYIKRGLATLYRYLSSQE